jgi:predicted nuclease of restriction endonuclease-like (RecB) superfamily
MASHSIDPGGKMGSSGGYYVGWIREMGDQKQQLFKEKTQGRELLENIHHFLIELGAGFAFVGQQYRLEVGAEEFFIDLLFYHLKTRCYVIVELKTTPFKPERAGKMNFY